MDYQEISRAIGTHKQELKCGITAMLFPAVLAVLLYVGLKTDTELDIESPYTPISCLITYLITFFVCYITIEAIEKEQQETQTIAKRIVWSIFCNTFFLFPIIGSAVYIASEILYNFLR